MEEDGDSATHNAQLKMNFFCVYMAAFLITGINMYTIVV
jgi:hypothetical protein